MEWDNLLGQVFEHEEDQQCWKKVRKVNLVFETNNRGRYDMGFEMFSALFPKVETLSVTGGNSKYELFSKKIKRFSYSRHKDDHDRNDTRILGRMLDRLLLEKVYLDMDFAGFRLPFEPYRTLTHLVIRGQRKMRVHGEISLDLWIRAFPNLRHLEVEYSFSTFGFLLGNIAPDVGLHLKLLKLHIYAGPCLKKIMSSFKNLVELDLEYRTTIFNDEIMDSDVSLVDLRNLKKLRVLGAPANRKENQLWLRQSVLQGCLATNRRDFILHYRPRRHVTDDFDTARFLCDISEVATVIDASVDISFKPEWLYLFSENLKVLWVPDNDPRKRTPSWTTAVGHLRKRGVQLGGKLAGIFDCGVTYLGC